MPDAANVAERSEYIEQYLREVFGAQDDHLASIMTEAVAQGLPDIAVEPEVGRLLMILTGLTRGRLAIEVGTLAGYSGIWITRGLSKGGRLITIESEPRHADFAQQQFRKAGVADRIELRRGFALDVLPALARDCPSGSVDLVFLDAVKTEYPEYWRLVRPLISRGGLIIADNILGAGDWWIGSDRHPSREAANQFNRMLARDAEFCVTGVPTAHGLLIGRRV